MFEVLEEVKENRGVLANGGTEQLKKWPLADDFAALMREHLVAKEMLAHSEEQLRDLKAEQNNTRVRREERRRQGERGERKWRGGREGRRREEGGEERKEGRREGGRKEGREREEKGSE